jgi:hypothetical protein
MKNFRKFEMITVAMFLFVCFATLNFVYAQEPTLISNEPAEEFDDFLEPDLRKEPVKEEDDFLVKDQGSVESIKTVAETVDDIRTDAKETEKNVKNSVKSGIDSNIIKIRKETDIPAYELQKTVDAARLELFEDLNTVLKGVNVTNIDVIDDLTETVTEKVTNIEEALENKSGLEADFEIERRDIRNTLLKLKTSIVEKIEVIENRDGDKIYEDTDGDGLSDYDEEFIYGTDPEVASTAGDGESDGDKVASGKNPKTGSKINHEDPREDVESYVTSAYDLENIALIKQEGKDLIKFEGKALPNSFVTLYIYSTPIIVTVKTDTNGDWNYELDKELENGEHKLYVATVNNSGKIIARSNPVSFTKTSEAASIGIVGIEVETSQAGDFFRDNFILIALAVLIAIVVLALMIIGREKGVKDVVTDLKNEVDSPNQNEDTKL